MQYGSNRSSVIPQAVNGIVDDNGNVVVSGETGFGASPLGVAARTQALFGIPNANFNLTPPSLDQAIVDGENPLPFWSVDDLSSGRITATMYFNDTDQTYAVELNPTAGSASDSFTLTTRSYLLNDTGISLRQKAYATLTKVNSYASTNQWNLTLTATYYDATGTSLSSYTIGTAADNATFTGINGFTTSGTAAISAAAQYVDLAFTLTCSANVTSTVKVQIESLLLQSSAGGGGGTQSFVIADTFTANGTWTRPASVNYVLAVVVLGAGGGGGGGAFRNGGIAFGGGGGASAHWAILNNLYVGDVGSVSVSIGAGGTAGPGTTYSKDGGVGDDWPASNTVSGNGIAGGQGGATSFGTYISMNGGGGGAAGTSVSSGGTTATGGTVAGTFTNIVYNFQSLGPSAGGTSVAYTAGVTYSSNGTSTVGTVYSIYPYTNTAAGTSGGAGTWTVNPSSVLSTSVTGGPAGAGGAKGMIGSGGGGGNTTSSVAGTGNTAFFKGGTGGFGGPGGGGAVAFITTNTGAGTWTVTGGTGGIGGSALGAGGGGGGAITFTNGQGSTNAKASAGTFITGSGGKGSDGYVAVIYVA